jgi:hypothetical protein
VDGARSVRKEKSTTGQKNRKILGAPNMNETLEGKTSLPKRRRPKSEQQQKATKTVMKTSQRTNSVKSFLEDTMIH